MLLTPQRDYIMLIATKIMLIFQLNSTNESLLEGKNDKMSLHGNF